MIIYSTFCAVSFSTLLPWDVHENKKHCQTSNRAWEGIYTAVLFIFPFVAVLAQLMLSVGTWVHVLPRLRVVAVFV